VSICGSPVAGKYQCEALLGRARKEFGIGEVEGRKLKKSCLDVTWRRCGKLCPVDAVPTPAEPGLRGVMKRICELIISQRPTRGMRCLAVRFGNVLGSNGSVVPALPGAAAEKSGSHHHASPDGTARYGKAGANRGIGVNADSAVGQERARRTHSLCRAAAGRKAQRGPLSTRPKK
jgi:Polysaccharide biosynthesis protein